MMSDPFRELEAWFERWLHGHRSRPRPVVGLAGVFLVHHNHPLRRRHLVTTVALKWTNPTTRVDGTALAPGDIASIDVFDTATPGAPIGNVPGGTATGTFVSGVLAVGDHGFTVVVNDTAGHRSDPSNVFSGTVVATLANPSAVTDLAGVFGP